MAIPLQSLTFGIDGMTCHSCEMLVEQTLKRVAGVQDAHADSKRASVTVLAEKPLNPKTVERALAGTQYSLRPTDMPAQGTVKPHWAETGAMLLIVIAAYNVLSHYGVFSLSAAQEGALGLSAIFVVGLTASVSSCLAVVGGLLLSVSAKWAEVEAVSAGWRKLKPLLLFNVGRLLGYFFLGGLIGVVGSALIPSVRTTGMVTLVIALVMIVLGLNILNIVPKRYCTLPLPRSMRNRIHGLAESGNPFAPLTLGALTFFLPCGFTQSMQLLALGSGGFLQGGLIMFTFALGTLPALLGISLVGSLSQGRPARIFLRFSGAVVLLLGFVNVKTGLLLSGFDIQWRTHADLVSASDQYVSIDRNGQQVITLYVSNQGYTPSSVTIAPNKSTWIYAVAPQGVSGCASMLTVPAYNLSTPIKQGENWLGPIQSPRSDFTIACSMGMMQARVHVKPS